MSFGLRGGKARVREPRDTHEAGRRRRHRRRRADEPGLEHLQPEHHEPDRRTRDPAGWPSTSPAHDARAVRHRVRDEPDAGARELAEEMYASAQLAARGFFGPFADVERFPPSFVGVRSADGEAAPVRPEPFATPVARVPAPARTSREEAWGGVEASSSSGPARPGRSRRATSSEHGAIVLRIESRTRPDFLRTMACRSRQPARPRRRAAVRRPQRRQAQHHAQLQAPDAVELVQRLVVEWADAVAENFAPRAMKSFGLDYDSSRRDPARPRDDEHVPERPDRTAPGLPRLRRPGLRARGLQRADRLARSRTRRPVRHDHRLARAALRRRRLGRGTPLRGAPAAASTSTCRRWSPRSGRSRRGCSTTRSTASSGCAKATAIAVHRCTVRSRAPTRTASPIVG